MHFEGLVTHSDAIPLNNPAIVRETRPCVENNKKKSKGDKRNSDILEEILKNINVQM